MRDIVEAGLAQHIIAEIAAMIDWGVEHRAGLEVQATMWGDVEEMFYSYGIVSEIAG